MPTLANAAFAPSPMPNHRAGSGFPRRAALTCLPLLGCLALASTAAAQGQPFGPAPGGQPFQPQQPGPAPFGPQQQPGPGPAPFGQPPPNNGQFGQPGQPGQFGQPPPGQPGQPGAEGQAQFGVDANLAPPPDQGNGAAPPAASASDEEQERYLSLMEQTNILGSTGLLRTSYAGSGAPGTFRVSFLTDWFSGSNFLCNPNNFTAGSAPLGHVPVTCGANSASDHASHVGAYFTLNVTPFSWLEGFASIRTYANSDDQGKPQLLEVLGDTTFGVKAFTPPKLGKVLSFGGEAMVVFLNGSGDVGLSGASTSADFRALATADFRKPAADGGGVPARLNLNLGYKVDNSGHLVSAIETQRAAAFTDNRTTDPISRIERFGLGINRVDFFQIGLGAEAPFSKIQPFLEYTIDVPVNRQGYQCHTRHVSQGDVCLGLADFSSPTPTTAGGPGYSAVPSRISLGVKTNPLDKSLHGLSAMLAFDIATGANSTFIEEVAPQTPWMLYVGLGYAIDTREKELPPAPAPVVLPPQLIPAPQHFVRGFVHELNRPDAPVVDALVSFEGGIQPPVATGPDGRFLTRNLEPGTYRFGIRANGYKPGVCQGTVLAQGPAPGMPGQPPAFGGPPGASPFGAPQGGMPGMQPSGSAPGQMPGQMQPGMAPPPMAAPPPSGPTYADIDCPLEALPRLGNVVGLIRDGETSAGVAGASVHATDSAGRPLSATTDAKGSFTFKDVQPGSLVLKAEAPNYMTHADQIDVRASEEAHPTITLNKRPKQGNVKIQGKEIRIAKQIHFEIDSAKISGDSNSLMEEIADVLQQNQKVRRVEIQGHTDNTGSREHNQQLSDARANAVRQWLISAGVDGSRLSAKGYGQDRPLAPNVTETNKAKNRRVQFIIQD